MKLDNNINFWRALLSFVNKIGAERAQQNKEWKVEDCDKEYYSKYMEQEGFDLNETDVQAAFERLKSVSDLKKEKRRIIRKIKELK